MSYYQIGSKIIETPAVIGSGKAENILTQLQGYAKDTETRLAVQKAAENIYKGFNEKLGFFGRLFNSIKCIFNKGDDYIQKVDQLYWNIMNNNSAFPAVEQKEVKIADLNLLVAKLQTQLKEANKRLEEQERATTSAANNVF